MAYWIKAFGPQIKTAPMQNTLVAALGLAFALTMIEVLMWSSDVASVALIAPFGASAVLIFYVSQGPFSQPWPVVVGNTVSALVGLALVWALPDLGIWLVPIAVALAMVAMVALNALHPPSGAVAMLVTLTHQTDWSYAFFPVALGSIILVASASLWGIFLRRRYPAKL